MSDHAALYQWTTVISRRFPTLTKPQVNGLALWSLGLVLTRSCALTAVSFFWATALTGQVNTLRQRLREWCYPAGQKRGAQRREVEVGTCFVPLLRWVCSWWQGAQVALAIDATTLGNTFVVLAVSVVYRGCAIPVAWVVLPAEVPHAWKHEWLRLLRRLRPALPARMTVLVLADRGLYARWLFRRIVRLGWHPFLRVNAGGTFRPAGGARFRRLSTFVPQPGSRWRGRGTAFQGRQRALACTLLAWRKEGCADAWLILTDLPPEASDAGWYGLRSWIEQGFRFAKRAGWQWQHTRMTDPDRAARLWLAVAVATLWLLSVGGLAEVDIPESTLLDVTAPLGQGRRQRRATRLRLVSVFRRGLTLIWVALLHRQPLPMGHFLPEPWPGVPRRHRATPAASGQRDHAA